MLDWVKVFSATKHKERDELGEVVTRWLRNKKGTIELVDKQVRQSSDSEYHCVTIIVFYNEL